MYPLLKYLHIACAFFSIVSFFLRGILHLSGSTVPTRSWVRRLTDLNDAFLLIAATGLVIVTGQYPFVAPWLTAKVIGLVLYIGLGIASFRLLRGFYMRLLAWLGALIVAGYIVSVALAKTPYGFFSFLLV
ncbi:MAG TPA: SirB2 family protein [Rhodocyclaceae bacterium]|jgi:uncharacterized membrane protein SirB2